MDMVRVTLFGNWAVEAQKRGYVVMPPPRLDSCFTRKEPRYFPNFWTSC